MIETLFMVKEKAMQDNEKRVVDKEKANVTKPEKKRGHERKNRRQHSR